MSTTITNDVVGLLAFELTQEDGTPIEGTAPGQLFAYLHGHENLPAPLESVLSGLSEGDTFDQMVPEAFGAATDVEPQRVRRKDLPKNVRDRVQAGLAFGAPGSDGTLVQLWVTAVRGSQVWVTTQHPLAGQTVKFAGTVRGVRQATQTELAHGHAHGVDGREPH